MILSVSLISHRVYAEEISTKKDPNSEVKLSEALEMAVRENPELKATFQKKEEAQANTSRAVSGIFPTLSAFAQAELKQDAASSPAALFGGDPYNSYGVGLSLEQSIFRGGRLWSGVDTALKREEIAELQYSQKKRDLIEKVIETFYQVLLIDLEVKTHLDQQKIQEDLLKVSKRQLRFGTVRELEPLRIQTKLALLVPRIEQSKNELQLQAATLANLLGKNQTESITVAGNLKPSEPLMKLAERYRDLSVAESSLEEKLQALAIDEYGASSTFDFAQNYPQVLLNAQIQKLTTAKMELLSDDTTSWNVGLKLSIPLFTGLSSVFERRAIYAKTLELQNQEQKIKDDAALRRLRANRNLKLALLRINTSEKTLEIAKRSLAVARKDHRLGRATYTPVAEASDSLVAAELDLHQSYFDLIHGLSSVCVAYGLGFDELLSAVHVDSGNLLDKPKETSER